MKNLCLEEQVLETSKKINDLTSQLNKLSLPDDIENVRKEFNNACLSLKKLKDELKTVVSKSVDLNTNFIASGLSVVDVKVNDIKKSLESLSIDENHKQIKESLTDIDNDLKQLKIKLDKSTANIEKLPIQTDIEKINKNINSKFANTDELLLKQIKEINQYMSKIDTSIQDKNNSAGSNLETINTNISDLHQNIVNSFNQEITDLNKALNAIKDGINNSVNSGAETVNSQITLVDTKLSELKDSIEKFHSQDTTEKINEILENKILPFNNELAEINSKILWLNNNFEKTNNIQDVKTLQEEVLKVQEQIQLISGGLEKNISDLDNKLTESIQSLLSDLSKKIGELDVLTKNSSSLMVTELSETFDDAKSEIKSDIASITELVTEIANKQNSQPDYEPQMVSITNKFNSLTEEINTLVKAIEVLDTRKQLNELGTEIKTEINTGVNSINPEIASIKDKLEENKKDLKVKTALIESLANEIVSKQANQPTNENLISGFNSLTETINTLAQSIEILNTQKQLNELEEDIKTEINAGITALNPELTVIKNKLAENTDSIQNKISDLSGKIGELNVLTKNSSSLMVTELSESFDDAKSEIKTDITSITELVTEIANKQSNQPDYEPQMVSITNKFNSLTEEINTLVKAIKVLDTRKQLNELGTEIKTEINSGINALNPEIASIKDKLTENKGDLNTKLALIETLTGEIAAKQGDQPTNEDIVSCFNSLTEMINTLAQSIEILDTQKQLNELGTDIKTEINSGINALNPEITGIKNKLEENIDPLQNKISDLSKKIGELDVLTKNSSSLMVTELSETFDDAKSEIKSDIASITELVTEIANTQNSQPDYEPQMVSITNKFNSLTEEINTLVKAIEVLDTRKQLNELGTEIKTEINTGVNSINPEIASIKDKLEENKEDLSLKISLVESLSNEILGKNDHLSNNIKDIIDNFEEALKHSHVKLSETIDTNIESAQKNQEYRETLKEFIKEIQLVFGHLDNKFNSNALQVNEQFEQISSNLADINQNSNSLQNLINQLPTLENSDSIQNTLSDLSKKIGELDVLTKNSSSLTVTELNESFDDAKSEIKTDIASIAALVTEIANKQTNQPDYEPQLASINSRFNSLSEKINSLSQSIEILDTQKQLNELGADIKTEINSGINALNPEIAGVKDKLTENTEDIQHKISDLSRKICELDVLTKNSSSLMTTEFSESLADVKFEIKTDIASIASLIAEAANKQGNQADSEELKSQLISVLTEKTDTLAQAIEVLDVRNQLNELKVEVKTGIDEKVNALNPEIASIKDKLEENKKDLSFKIALIESLTNEIIEKQNNQADNESLRSQIVSIDGRLKSLIQKDDIQDTRDSIEQVKNQLVEEIASLKKINIQNMENITKETLGFSSIAGKINNSLEKISSHTNSPDIKDHLSTISKQLLEYKLQLKSIISERISQLDANIAKSENNDKLMFENISDLNQWISELIEENQKTNEKMNLINDTSNESFKIMKNLSKLTQDFTDWTNETGNTIESINADIQNTKKTQNNYENKLNEMTLEIQKINENQQVIQDSLEKIRKALRI